MSARVLVTRRWPEACQTALAERFDVTFNSSDAPMSPQALADALKSFDAVAPTVSDKLTAEMFDGATAKIVSNYGVGYTNIDVEAASRGDRPAILFFEGEEIAGGVEAARFVPPGVIYVVYTNRDWDRLTREEFLASFPLMPERDWEEEQTNAGP